MAKTKLRKHKHKWSYSRGFHPLPKAGRCNANVCPNWCARRRIAKYGYTCERHRCAARIVPEWWGHDQAMWVAALDIVRMLYADPFELVEFATIWRNELILGERRGL